MEIFIQTGNDVRLRTTGKIEPKFLIVEMLLPKHCFSHFNVLCLVFHCSTRLGFKGCCLWCDFSEMLWKLDIER